jgi:isocitrate dehydrogenase (NAD+)
VTGGRRRRNELTYTVTLIPGDGIGPELADATVTVLGATGIDFDWRRVDAGESQIAAHGTPLPACTPISARHGR